MSKIDVDIIKGEETKMNDDLHRVVERVVNADDEGLANEFKKIVNKKVGLELEKELNTPRPVRVTNEITAKVQFPEKQKIWGMVNLLNKIGELEHSFKSFALPSIFKVQGSVKAEVDFPQTQKVEGNVNAKVQFPDIQKVDIQKFPELQKIEGNVKTDVPRIELGNLDAVPIVFTDGKRLVNPFTTVVQGNGKLATIMQNILNQLRASVSSSTGTNPNKDKQVTTITSSTAETTIITSIAGVKTNLYGLILSNTSTSSCEVTLRDATGGGTAFSIQVPATDTRGFMLRADDAIPQGTANNNWTATCGTSVASMKVTALYVKGT